MDTQHDPQLFLVSADAITGETVTRELTAEEIAALPEPSKPITTD